MTEGNVSQMQDHRKDEEMEDRTRREQQEQRELDQAVAKVNAKVEGGKDLTPEERALWHDSQSFDLEAFIDKLKPDPDHVPVYEIQPMKAKHTRLLIGMIRKVRNAEGVRNAALQGGMEAAVIELFGALLDEVEDEILPLMAELAGMTMEELDEKPGAAPFDIAGDLMNSEGFLSALASALRLVKAGQKLFGR